MSSMDNLIQLIILQTFSSTINEFVKGVFDYIQWKLRNLYSKIYRWWYSEYYYSVSNITLISKYGYKNTLGTLYFKYIKNYISTNITSNGHGYLIESEMRDKCSIQPTTDTIIYDSIDKITDRFYVSINKDDPKKIIEEITIYTTRKPSSMAAFANRCMKEYNDLFNASGKKYIFNYIEDKHFANNLLTTIIDTETVIFQHKDTIDRHIQLMLKGKISHVNIMLYGDPGCGKTTVGKYLAKKYNKHVIVPNLDTMTPANFKKMLYDNHIQTQFMIHDIPQSERIYIFEDIDAISNTAVRKTNTTSDTSKKEEEKEKITLSDMLNAFDGINELEGTIMLFTTNHIDKIDPALIRPGRMTLKLEMTKLPGTLAIGIIKQYFPDASVTIDLDGKLTIGTLHQICLNSDTTAECLNRIRAII